MILPNTNSEGARQVAEKIRAALRARRVIHAANPSGCVTISVGSATIVPTLGDHASTLIQRADEALYRAKHAGRDRF